jgi:hypothetical protein
LVVGIEVKVILFLVFLFVASTFGVNSVKELFSVLDLISKDPERQSETLLGE